MVQNPVLFITFARPDYARRTWDAIKAAKPSKLYFYSNKGREDKEGEVEKNNQIRAFVKEIEWECDLHTWFREECVDVYTSLYGAISWLFENEEQGIILEEDCVASLAFFDYCDKLLPKYKDDYRIWMISGDNYFDDQRYKSYDYFFSQYMQIYGWASWKSRWQQVHWENGLSVSLIKENNIVESIIRTRKRQRYYVKDLMNVEEFVNKTKCWDYLFLIHGILNNSLSIVPASNLVENIGLSGIHNKKEKKSVYNREVKYKGDTYTINSIPPYIAPNIEYDTIMFKKLDIKRLGLFYKILSKLKRII